MIYVITHKIFDISKLDQNHYIVLHVGNNENYEKDYLHDNTGDNISHKNLNYCELTGLYWIWKNGKEQANDIIGIVHYRRFFTKILENFFYNYGGKKPEILSYSVIERVLNHYDIILPKKKICFRKVKTTYGFFHCYDDIEIMRRAIEKICPEYLEEFNRVMNSHGYYYANMMICRKHILDKYAEWLFAVMKEIELNINIDKYKTDYQKRVFGFMAERLLQVWVMHNELRIKEFSVFNSEEKGENIFESSRERVNRLFRQGCVIYENWHQKIKSRMSLDK